MIVVGHRSSSSFCERQRRFALFEGGSHRPTSRSSTRVYINVCVHETFCNFTAWCFEFVDDPASGGGSGFVAQLQIPHVKTKLVTYEDTLGREAFLRVAVSLEEVDMSF